MVEASEVVELLGCSGIPPSRPKVRIRNIGWKKGLRMDAWTFCGAQVTLKYRIRHAEL